MLDAFLLRRYPGDFERTVAIREFVEKLCRWFVDSGRADKQFLAQLCSGDEARYWQRLSEALLARELAAADLSFGSSNAGPDFVLEANGRRIWIEAICPMPSNVPAEWLRFLPGEVKDFPHQAMLLRWTAAIKEKAEKLLGNPEKGLRGYLDKGIVGPDEAYVIAVNGRMLRHVFPEMNGISGFPFAAEATFGVGCRRLHLDRATRRVLHQDYAHNPYIMRPQGEPVPACAFLDDRYRAVSAIWATDLDDTGILGNPRPMVVVHNPYAANPISVALLPAFDEYVLTVQGETGSLDRLDGRLNKPAPRA